MIKTKKFTLKSLLVLLIAIAIMATGNITYAATFTDVSTSHWAYDFITNLNDRGIIKGYADGSFGPNREVTRGQAAKMIAIAAGLDYKGKEANFKDVPKDHEYSPYIAALEEVGAVGGYIDGRFGRNDNISRRQIAQIIVKAFNLKAGDKKVAFTDISNLPAETRNYIEILASNGIVTGPEKGRFNPNGLTTRAQFSQILTRSMEMSQRKPASHNVEVTGISYIGDNKIEIASTGKLDYTSSAWNNNLIIDIKDSKLSYPVKKILASDSKNINEIRYSQYSVDPMTTRLVIDLTGEFNFTINSNNTSTIITIEKDTKPTKPTKPSETTVVIDPGHGGNDSGATGNGYLEKDINLSVALKVESELLKLGYNVVMTRRTDVRVELRDRPPVANNIGADIFVSIHTNSADSAAAKGIETYSYPGSSQGALLARSIHDEVTKDKTLFTSNRGIKVANFLVLRETKMPSALIELGFIKNSEDIKILTNKQNDFGIAIAKGINKYFIEYIFE